MTGLADGDHVILRPPKGLEPGQRLAEKMAAK
jgi:hypothetical protein